MRLFICLSVLLLLLTACSSNTDGTEQDPTFDGQAAVSATDDANTGEETATPPPSESDSTPQIIYSLTDLIPQIDEMTTISVRTFPEVFAFNAFAPADNAQAKEIMDFLMLLETTEFKEEGYADGLYGRASILIENAAGSCQFEIIGDVDDYSIFKIVLYPDQTAEDILAGEEQQPVRFFKGQSGEFPIRDFNDALNDVLFDNTDLDNVAVVQKLDSDEPACTFFKGHTATVKQALEDAIELYSTFESPEEQNFDI